MLASALIMAVFLVGGEPDGVVATAPRTPVVLDPAYTPNAPSVAGATQEAAPHGLTTDQQIDAWLASRNADARPFEADGELDADGAPVRRMRSEFSASIGTGGFRQYGAAVEVPLGERGWLGLSYEQSENGYRDWGYGPGDPPPYWFDDSGHVFPGRNSRARAWEHERRIQRPGGPPVIGGSLLTPRAEE